MAIRAGFDDNSGAARNSVLPRAPCFYCISCSKEVNSSLSKNCASEISNPSHTFFIVDTVGLLLPVFTMLLNVVNAEIKMQENVEEIL